MPDEPWHNCDGTICQFLVWVTPREGMPTFNDGKPGWAFRIGGPYGPTYLHVTFCPVCGEELEARQDET